MRFGLRHIRYCLAVAETRHFRRAAERLGISQPALSRAIQHLERELGVRLFDRGNKRVRITEAGSVFVDGCLGALQLVEQTVDRTRRTDAGEIGSLQIGYTDLAIDGRLPALLSEFRQLHPDIVLRPRHAVTGSQLKQLEAGDLDIGFATGPINRPDMESCPVQKDALLCVVPRNHAFASRSGIMLAELANEPFVLGTARDWEHFYAYLIPLCRQAGFVPNVVQEAYNSAGILGLVACGMGVTVLTESVLANTHDNLVTLPLKNVTEQLTTVAVWRTDERSGPKDLFIGFVRSHAMIGDQP